MNNKPIVVVGSGPSGLMQALYLAGARKRQVVIIEQQATLGGMFAGVTTPWGVVDQGVHILQEVGCGLWDQLFFDIFPTEDLRILEGVRKDIAGNIFQGCLNEGALYPDLRRLPREDYLRCVGEMIASVAIQPISFSDVSNLAGYFEARFGGHARRTVFETLAHKIWRQPLEQLSPWAAKIVHLSRVVTHEADVTLALKSAPALDALLGFPNQLNFPPARLSNARRSFYPRRYGLHNVVSGLRRALESLGVQFFTATQVERLEIVNQRLVAIQLAAADGSVSQRLEVDALLWSSPQVELLKYLDLPRAPLPDPPLPHRIVYLFLNAPPSMGELYWLWSYDPGDSLVRVSNPAAYCPDAAANGIYPVCIEMHVGDSTVKDEAAIKQAEQEMRMRGLIGTTTKVLGSTVLPGGRGFFVPTIANCAVQVQQRHAIAEVGIKNLIVSTQDINTGRFYLSDILHHSVAALDQL